jgi:hypothetical protein
MASYYYLLASLPQWSWADEPRLEALREAQALIERQIAPADRAAYNWLLYRNDVRNFIRLLQDQRSSGPERPWTEPCSLRKSEWEEIRQNPEQAPPFLREWLESQDGKEAPPGAAPLEERLMALFFEGAAGAPHPFLRQYFGFEDELQAVIATYQQGQYDFLDQETPYLREELRQNVKKGQAGLTENLRLSLPYLPGLLETLATRDAAAIRHKVLELRWQQAEELGRQHFFDLTHLLAYGARLDLLFQKNLAAPPQGEAPFSALIRHVLKPQNHTA